VNTREKLVTEAARLLDAGGDAAVTLRAVAQAVGVSHNAPYRHFEDRSVAFSGDTTAVEAMSKIARGADVLVHEALYLPALEAYVRDRIAKGFPAKFDDFMAHMKADHTPVEDVGRIAREAGVKTLVLSHLSFPKIISARSDDAIPTRLA
jgi:ribonuclease BN (tRNA processing enzyme)